MGKTFNLLLEGYNVKGGLVSYNLSCVTAEESSVSCWTGKKKKHILSHTSQVLCKMDGQWRCFKQSFGYLHECRSL